MFSKPQFQYAVMLVLAASCSIGRAQAVDAQSPDAGADDYRSNPKFVEAMKEGKDLEHQKRLEFAKDDYKKANKIAGGRCVDCLSALYRVQMLTGSYKDAIGTAATLQEVAATPAAKSMGAFDRGRALLQQGGDKPKPAQLEAAHAAFQDALTLNPRNASALFLDGKVLAMLGKADEARADFQQCLSCIAPNDPARFRAQHFAENPELATHKMAPTFEVTALDGSKFNLDAMGGKVVLIDFWATWCGPCNEELPHMKKIAKEFAGEPLVIISVSWDSDAEKWKAFLEKNEMTWVQYRDADHKLSEAFGVEAIPHYFTIDSDGVLTAEMMGSGSDVEGKLKKLIAKARQAQAEQAGKVAAAGN
jgi:thiol-disulfide isomerase/thioredoxin